ncbi:MAG: 4-hydroxybenzoate octaprenyltransferase [Oceanospirillaceae bacterium]|jgi:4-hydroxybenzoate polyprenyltransferase|nr:4-hydroxybenzoate octaprenyltransferase [Oceanospirillaceae bacterium]MBT4443776.1 4-hydroxybenzoate octaprenyltransferase [Oceanospirillaceae bacterium]MBT6076532.1 4-hydroxybenzoate octaprenyltransferase [Oceanospirillaceae bacterium]
MLITHRWHDYKQLMRLDKPVGTYLLLWPMLWALWLAAEGMPRLDLLCIFVVGTYLMRAAGCVINDYADRHLDGHVERTKQRPLATGKITSTQALMLFFGLCSTAFVLVLFTNTATIKLSVIAVILAATYPFMKRYTHWPQAVLGAAFAMAIPMAFSAQTGTTGMTAWLTFTAAVCMTIAYDTYYAMVDREDDLHIGIKSTALLFGHWDVTIIGLFQAICVSLLMLVGEINQLGVFYYLGLATMTGLFVYQNKLGRSRVRSNYFSAFTNSHWAALCVWIGLVMDFI